jgi:hypothetical protein
LFRFYEHSPPVKMLDEIGRTTAALFAEDVEVEASARTIRRMDVRG